MFAKIFCSLWDGSMCGRSSEQLVFIYLLARADRTGIADIHPQRISADTGLEREKVDRALLNLEAPDPESRSPEEAGARIMRLDEHRAWGWQVVNYARYRSIRDEDDRREQDRIRKRNVRQSPPVSAAGPPRSAHVDVEAEASRSPIGDLPGDAAVNDPDPGHGSPANGTGKAPTVAGLGPGRPALALDAPPAQPMAYGPALPIAGGVEWTPPRGMAAEWTVLYPAVRLDRALKDMRGWLLSHPKRRPTAQGIAAFVNNWLRGNQDKAAQREAVPSNRRGTRRGSDERYMEANERNGNG